MRRAASRAATAMAILLIIYVSVGSDARDSAVDHPRRAEAVDQHTKVEGDISGQAFPHFVSPSGASASESAAARDAARSSAALSKDAAAAKTAPRAKATW